MQDKILVKIQFCFPLIPRDIKDKREFVKFLIEGMRENKSIGYAGYLKDEDLSKDLALRISDKKEIGRYQPLNTKQKHEITKTIQTAVAKCHRKLPRSSTPVFVFVFPWFPGVKDSNAFGGVNASAPYKRTIHLFVASGEFTQTSLKETVVHEFNHLGFYQYHDEKNYTLLDHIAIEGLAENFREEVVGGKPAPWSIALTKKDARDTFRSLRPLLRSKNARVHRDVLFGGKRYKRWTGYSVGYRLVKEFRKKHPSQSWGKILKMKAREVLDLVL